MNDLPCRPTRRHGAVGDQGGAREIAGVLEDADEEEQQQDLRQEDDHGADAAPDAVDKQRAEEKSGSSGAEPAAETCSKRSIRVHRTGRRR